MRLAICAALALCSLAGSAFGAPVRIALQRIKAPAVVSADGLQYLHTSGQWAAFPGNSINPTDASRIPAGAAQPLRLRAETGVLSVEQPDAPRTYRGVLEIAAANPLRVINEIDLEEYLLCVVPSEMPAFFPQEALRAQAVAARSYAMASMGKHKDLSADLCDTTCCQAYRGATAMAPQTDLAVQATAGQFLEVNGKPLYAQYSAVCGGYSKQNPALGPDSAHPDTDEAGQAYCREARYYSWDTRVTQAELLAAAGEARPTPLRKLRVVSRDSSGRLESLELGHDFGVSTLSGAAFREKLGLSRVRGLLCSFAADPSTGDILVSGRGWGHGIGLCQWGARGMALPPASKSYTEIIQHYYPGATIKSAVEAR